MLMTNLSKVGQLSKYERRLLFQSVLFLPTIHITLYLLGYYRLRGVMEKMIPIKPFDNPASETQILQRAQEIARIVSIAAKHGFYKATCLRKSLLVWGFMRRQGIQGRICFGVRMIEGRLEAHAWVEYQGIVINDSMDVHKNYRALNDVFPPSKFGL